MGQGAGPLEDLAVTDSRFYAGKRVLITGHTGFKGAWLALWLKNLGAEVAGYALPPHTSPSLFEVLRLEDRLTNIFDSVLHIDHLHRALADFKPEIVFHLAAQSLVRLSYTEPLNTYQVNVSGGLNVLEAARQSGSVRALVCVTSDKCYENRGEPRGYVETDPLGGWDMYSSSKACLEILASSYRRSFLSALAAGPGYSLATARAGNVIGGGDWSPDRLIPDCVRAIHAGRPVEIRNPAAVRPWQHVLEPLSGYLRLGRLLFEGGPDCAQAYNFGPDPGSALRVADLAAKLVEYYGQGEIIVHQRDDFHEDALLALNIARAETVLGWRPVFTVEEALQRTVRWYKAFYEGREDMLDLTLEQIDEFVGRQGVLGS